MVPIQGAQNRSRLRVEGPTRNGHETDSREHSGCKRDSKTTFFFCNPSWYLHHGCFREEPQKSCLVFIWQCTESRCLAAFYMKPWFLRQKHWCRVRKFIPRIWLASFKQTVKDVGFIPARQLSNCLHQYIFPQSIHRTELSEKTMFTFSFPIGLKILNLHQRTNPFQALWKENAHKNKKKEVNSKVLLLCLQVAWLLTV